MKIEHIPDAVYSACREMGMSPESIMTSSPKYLFEQFCTWQGLINWGGILWEHAMALQYGASKES